MGPQPESGRGWKRALGRAARSVWLRGLVTAVLAVASPLGAYLLVRRGTGAVLQ